MALELNGTTGVSLVQDGVVTAADMFSGFANGITMADQWRLSASFQGDATPINTNLEQVDTDGFSNLGSSMTESSGVFTFPTTGIYLIVATIYFAGDNLDSRFVRIKIATTTDGSNFGEAATAGQSLSNVSTSQDDGNASANFIFGVTNASTHKVRFEAEMNNQTAYVLGNSGFNRTFFTFIRLGDSQ